MVRTCTASSVQINGPALRAIRERTGVSCSALARAVGADGSFLARVEKGEKRGVRRETYDRIVAELGIDGRAILVDPYGVGCCAAATSGVGAVTCRRPG